MDNFIIKNKRFDIPYTPHTPYNNEECSICLEKQNETTVKLDICNHLYHEKCIKMCLEKSNLCPLCRKDVYDNICNCNCNCNSCIIT